jgi:hypothetical protein
MQRCRRKEKSRKDLELQVRKSAILSNRELGFKMQNINVATAKTAELLAFYNANSGKAEIKKFASRTAAEKQVTALISADFAAQGALNIDAQSEVDNIFASGAPQVTSENAAFIFPKAADFISAVNATNALVKVYSQAEIDAQEVEAKEFYAKMLDDAYAENAAFDINNASGAPQDNSESDAAEAEYERQALEAEIEASANPKANPKHDAEPVERAARRSNALGVSLSWGNPEVRAARLIRDGVTVTVDGVTSAYPSVRQAFRAYRLPDSVHIRFRLKLKSSRKEVFNYKEVDYLFEII